MESACQSDSFFQIKTEEEEMEFELEDLHHSIDIKDETPVLEFQRDDECMPETMDKRMASADIPYKACMVPKCRNTTVKTPEKLFISVLKCAEVRRKWCNAMNRDERKSVSHLSTLYCCGDHFTLKDDLENYWQYKLVGSVKKLRLRKGVIPHKFRCQEQTLPVRGASAKRKRFEEVVEQTEIKLAVGDPKPGRSATSPITNGGNLSEIEEPAVIELYIPYKTCLVPKCTNTTVKTPEKLFLSVPRKADVRRKWCIAMNRDGRKPLSSISALYVCEDHFTLKDDLENYWQCKLAGDVKKLRLRQGVVPHKFHCQEQTLLDGGASVKHERIEEIFEQAEIEFVVGDPKPEPGHSDASFCTEDATDSKDDEGNLSEIEEPAVINLYLPYKTCMVPKCTSTTVKTPEKIFISVPRKAEIRRKWCTAMKRDGRPLSVLSSLYCCEDHFTLEDDLSNYWQHKLTGDVKKFLLKKGVVPHKFHCQEENTT